MKIITLNIVILMLVQIINAQTDSCKVLLEKISGTYSGKCLNGLANGDGKSIGEDTYVGTFKDGLPDGKGKYLFKNGDIFQGYWRNGQKCGKGKFNYTLNNEKNTLIGYWENDEYMGVLQPNVPYRVSSSSGIFSYKVEKNKPDKKNDNEVILSVKSAFTDFLPSDLQIEKSSGQIIQTGKKFGISQYFLPLHCEITYTILIANTRKQCRFVIDVLEEGKYTITLSND